MFRSSGVQGVRCSGVTSELLNKREALLNLLNRSSAALNLLNLLNRSSAALNLLNL